MITLPNEAMSLKGKQLGTLSCVPAKFELLISGPVDVLADSYDIHFLRWPDDPGDLGRLKVWTSPTPHSLSLKS